MTFPNTAQSQTETGLPLKGLTIICDLDYTFLDYDSRGELFNIGERSFWAERLRMWFKPLRVVHRMDDLLITLQNKGAEIRFLSARPKAHYTLIRKFINSVGLSEAHLQLADAIANSGAYKSEHIIDFATKNPEQKIILIGDNLDYDVQAFDMVRSKLSIGGQVILAFVRAVRRSRPIPSEYFHFSDASNIASLLRKIGLLTDDEAKSILLGKKVNSNHLSSGSCKDLFQ